MTEKQIESIISKATFHEAKSRDIRAIAIRTVKEFGGSLPAELGVLTVVPRRGSPVRTPGAWCCRESCGDQS
jgi:endonuclease III